MYDDPSGHCVYCETVGMGPCADGLYCTSNETSNYLIYVYGLGMHTTIFYLQLNLKGTENMHGHNKTIILCCMALIFSLLLCSCADSRTRDSGSYSTDKRLCWIKHDTHYENDKPVNIAELYVTKFDGRKYTSSIHSLNEVFGGGFKNWKILQNQIPGESGTIYIANYNSQQIDIVGFTLSDGFSDTIYHCSLHDDTFDHAVMEEGGEPFALTDEFVYFTALKKSGSNYTVSVCRYSKTDDSNDILIAYTISSLYYSAPVLSCTGDILFIAESLDTTEESPSGDTTPKKTYLYILSQGEIEYIDEARLAIWTDDGSSIIYQPLAKQYMLYGTASKKIEVYVDDTLGRNPWCNAFAVSGNDIAYWADQPNIYVRDGLFTWTQMVPDGVKLALLNKETGEEMVIVGYDTFNQFEHVDCSSLVWIE